ncbi:hypothetical protein IACHDJAJ_00165 [Aeromonas phage vB_AdhS_TS3]|nr:hypothetical protein IACHDJAJ_00165 [Aeromonas phage vB_AdhS_TS3]
MVPNFPFTFSQAITEFGGNGSASDLLARAGLPSTGAMSQLALAVKFALISLITTTSSPYLYFTFDGTYTICHHNNGGT